MSSHMQSSGRGGAGNMIDSSKTTQIQPEDLQTPTLKTPMVTTGRGGTGNMAANLDAEEKRRRQDVEPVVRTESQGATVHIGRGGTGNVARAGSEDNDNAAPLTPPLPEQGDVPSPTEKEKEKEEKKDEKKPSGLSRVLSRTPADNTAAAQPHEPGLVEKGMNLLFGKKS